jgi:putative ABC transport system permease protein
MNDTWRNLRIAVRQWVRQPSFSLAVISTLALAIGANVAVFSVVNAVLLRELPFALPRQLVWITSVRPDNPTAPFSLPEFIDYRAQVRTLSGLAAYANWSANIAADGFTERLQGARMSANAFDVLGIQPVAGRLLHDSDDRADAPAVAVVSHRLWLRLFGGGDVAGRSLRINGESFSIVGVLPPHFPLPLRDIDVVIPLAPDRDPSRYVRTSVNFLRLFGRLNPATSADHARVDLTSICRALKQRFPQEYARKDAVGVIPLHDVIVGDYRQSMLLLLGAVAVVFGTAVANLVSLVLVRANERRAELSIRIAIGASRLQLLRQLALEAFTLTALGAGLGVVLAKWAIQAALPFVPASIPRLGEVDLDTRVLIFGGGLTAIVTSFLSVASLGTVLRARAGDALLVTSRGTIGARWNQRVRHVLVAAEIAVALVLLVGTIVLVQGLLRLQQVQPGFTPDRVFQARVAIPPTYRSQDDVSRFYDRLSEKLAASPGVRDVGVISVAPLSGLLATVEFSVAGQPPGSDRDVPTANFRVITPGYLSAAGTRLIQGRSLMESDRADAPPVALVSAALAERFFRGTPIGHRLLVDDNSKGPRPVEVVGVVEDVRQAALDAPATFDIYIPLRQIHPEGIPILRNNQFWMVRTDTEPEAFRQTFLNQLRAIDPDAAIANTGTMRQYLEAWLGPRRFNLGLFAAFSFTAVFMALLGLYALVSYSVSQRRREIGLRMAIGATERDVHRLVVRQALGLAAAGVISGLVLVGLALPVLARSFKDAAVDPVLVTATIALLMSTATIAAWLPARRAARIPPSITLKDG